MEYSKIAYKLRAKIAGISGEVALKLDKTARRFTSEAVYGILTSESVVLTKIGRTLEDDVSVKKIEERFCRQLGKHHLWERIHQALLRHASTRMSDEMLLILDLSDIQKQYAKKMEYAARVRDGSEGIIGNKGYWTCHVIATKAESNTMIPLYQSLYSQDAPDFRSENEEIKKAIALITTHIGSKGIYVIDRGGDRGEIFKPLLSKNLRFIIRLVGDRHLVYNGKRILALELAEKTKPIYSETIVRIYQNREKVYLIQVGYWAVRLPGYDRQLWLVVVKGFGEKPMMLLTTEPVKRNQVSLERIVHGYIKRWSIEETIRFLKQTYDLEDIRLLRYHALQNMMALLLLVFYFLAVFLDNNQRMLVMAGHILKSAKRVFGIPDFRFYALGDGISALFERTPGTLWKKQDLNDPDQITLGFT